MLEEEDIIGLVPEMVQIKLQKMSDFNCLSTLKQRGKIKVPKRKRANDLQKTQKKKRKKKF